jgi:hypothetical protein
LIFGSSGISILKNNKRELREWTISEFETVKFECQSSYLLSRENISVFQDDGNWKKMELCRNWHQNKSVFKTIPAFWLMSAKMWTAPNIFADERVAGL